MAEINALKAQTKLVKDYHALLDAVTRASDASQAKATLQRCEVQLASSKAQEAQLIKQLKQLQEQAAAAQGDVQPLFVRRKAIFGELDSLYDEVKKLKAVLAESLKQTSASKREGT